MTVHELWHWVLEHPDYPALYQAWVDSGYHRDFAPSVDRIDCDHPTDAYTLNNIELTTTHMNRAKQNIEMRRRREREYEQTAAVA